MKEKNKEIINYEGNGRCAWCKKEAKEMETACYVCCGNGGHHDIITCKKCCEENNVSHKKVLEGFSRVNNDRSNALYCISCEKESGEQIGNDETNSDQFKCKICKRGGI